MKRYFWLLILLLPIFSFAQTIVIDNTDPGYTELEGYWSDYVTAIGYNGLLRRSYASDAVAQWSTILSSAGTYEVAVWFGYFPFGAEKTAIYTVAGNTDPILEFPFDQDNRDLAGKWNVLGEFEYDGTFALVSIRTGPDAPVIADAVRFQLIENGTDLIDFMPIEEIKYWRIDIHRLTDNLNMEEADTLRIDSTDVAGLHINFVQPLYREAWEEQPEPITFTRGDSSLDRFFTIDPDSGSVIEDSAFVEITREFELELGNWAWTGRPVDIWYLTSKGCNWQSFRLESAGLPPVEPPEKPPTILIKVHMILRKN